MDSIFPPKPEFARIIAILNLGPSGSSGMREAIDTYKFFGQLEVPWGLN